MAPWSVTAIAVIPSSAARERSVLPCHDFVGATMREAPSRSEYSVCVWRWTNPLPNRPSCVYPGGRLLEPPKSTATGARTARGITTMLFARLPVDGARRKPNARSTRSGVIQGGDKVLRQGILHLDALARPRVVEGDPPRMQERPGQAQLPGVGASPAVGPIA